MSSLTNVLTLQNCYFSKMSLHTKEYLRHVIRYFQFEGIAPTNPKLHYIFFLIPLIFTFRGTFTAGSQNFVSIWLNFIISGEIRIVTEQTPFVDEDLWSKYTRNLPEKNSSDTFVHCELNCYLCLCVCVSLQNSSVHQPQVYHHRHLNPHNKPQTSTHRLKYDLHWCVLSVNDSFNLPVKETFSGCHHTEHLPAARKVKGFSRARRRETTPAIMASAMTKTTSSDYNMTTIICSSNRNCNTVTRRATAAIHLLSTSSNKAKTEAFNPLCDL